MCWVLACRSPRAVHCHGRDEAGQFPQHDVQGAVDGWDESRECVSHLLFLLGRLLPLVLQNSAGADEARTVHKGQAVVLLALDDRWLMAFGVIGWCIGNGHEVFGDIVRAVGLLHLLIERNSRGVFGFGLFLFWLFWPMPG